MTILDNHLREHTYRKVDDIIAYIESEFDEEYSVSGVTALLHRMGYSYKKPRCVPGKASQEAQFEFIEKYKEIRKNMSEDDHMLFMDGAHPQHNPLVMCGWIKKGKANNKNIKTNTRYHRLNVTGAVDVDTLDVVSHFSKKMNEESTLDFLEKIRIKFPTGRLYLVLDNAGYYNTNRIREYAKATAIELLYLPPYSPNLNIVERLWLYFQKVTLYNRYYETFEKFEIACRYFFKNAWRHKGALKNLLTENFEIVGA